MFVTTADPVLEPPIITLNTVLSLLAVDYPANKLACYVSDDGCSPVTFFALVEASKFAKLWVPFCKKYSVQVRAPFRYFSNQTFSSHENSPQFRKDWQQMKEEYEQLCRKIQDATQNGVELTGEFTAFAIADRRKHPAIIKVIWENEEDLVDGIPHLVYISREKRPNYPHHYKAGAMNVLTRVSGVMVNAPFMLNVDCDMYANNPQVVLHAMCLLLGSKNERDAGFVQCPQKYYDAFKDDPLGNQHVVFQHFIGRGTTAIQGPHYVGTGCFHRRKIIYGLAPDESQLDENLSGERLESLFGESKKLCESAAFSLSGSRYKPNNSGSFSSSMEAAHHVAGCGYENGTCWGTEVGWVYGSLTEDALTGLRIHTKGWSSLYFDPHPDPPAFMGCTPTSGPGSMTQHKRWATGLLEILFSKHSPLVGTLSGKLQFRACLFYSWLLTWGLRAVPEFCYTFLPAYCIITNTSFLPKVEDPAILIPVTLFIMYNVCTLREYSQAGQSIKAWWNNQKMGRVHLASALLFGFIGVLLKFLGISETVFEVTQKDQSSPDNGDEEAESNRRFTFDESPVFVPGTTLVLLNLTCLGIFLLRLLLQQKGSIVNGRGRWCVVFWFCFAILHS
ncbi:hypothetical protein Dimus_009684 [Dionaea muscipula]